jgi:uncharacterized protein YaiI (UPF0178 family)
MLCRFYVYILFRLDGRPCYVGKGKGNRWQDHDRYASNIHLRRIIAKSGGPLPGVIVRDGLTEDEAYATEIAFIAAIGREANGGPLVNMTDGGEGLRNPAPETLEKIKAARKRQKIIHTAETRLRISLSNKGRIIPEHQREAVRQSNGVRTLSQAHRAAFAVNRLLSWSPEALAKKSATLTGRVFSAETIAKMSASAKLRKSSDETRRKISVALTGRPCSPETRAKMTPSRRRTVERKRAQRLPAIEE